MWFGMHISFFQKLFSRICKFTHLICGAYLRISICFFVIFWACAPKLRVDSSSKTNERFVICVATACWKHATSDEFYLARLRYHPEHMHIYKVRDSTQLGSYNIHSSKCSLSTMVHGLRHCYIDNLVCTLISCVVEHFSRRWNQIFPQHMYKFQTHIPCKTISIGWYSNEHPRFKHACRWCESVLCGTCLDWYMFFLKRNCNC